MIEEFQSHDNICRLSPICCLRFKALKCSELTNKGDWENYQHITLNSYFHFHFHCFYHNKSNEALFSVPWLLQSAQNCRNGHSSTVKYVLVTFFKALSLGLTIVHALGVEKTNTN